MKFPKPWHRKVRGWFVTLDGQQIKLGNNKADALKRYQEIMAQPKKAVVVSSDSILAIIDTFLDWCHKHRAPDTYEWYRYRLERFAKRYPNLSVADLRPFHVQEWIDEMPLSSGSKRNFCRAIKRCMRWAKRQGYVDINAIADLEQPKAGKRETVISVDEFNDILDVTANSEFIDLLNVTWETGCRPQESLRVEARHVDLVNQRWIFSESEAKTDQPRIVYLTDTALVITKRLMERFPKGKLFRNSKGVAWTTDAVNCAFTSIQIRLGRRLLDQRARQVDRPADKRRKYIVDDAAVAELLKTLNPFKQSGVAKTQAELLHESRRKLLYQKAKRIGPKYSLYVIRHTWMNRLLKQGVDALTVAFLAGHADPSTLAKVYAHLSQDRQYLLNQVRKGVA